VHYWHAPSRQELPRKPDGMPLCSYCCRNLAVHTCSTCTYDYCFYCHRWTHAHPWGFEQKRDMTVEEQSDTNFLVKLNCAAHDWKPTEHYTCQICKTTKMLAGVRCEACGYDMCRPCSRKIHAVSPQDKHTLQFI
jgi:hypothetical protein